MALLKAARTSQDVQAAEFVFNYNDTAVDSVAGGTAKTFGSVYTDAIVFDAINMPAGATIIGGELIVETAGVGPTAYTAALGVSGNTAALLAATSLLATGRTALLLTTPLLCNAGANVRLTIASTVANATAGKFRVRVMYTIDGRAEEVVPS